METDGQPSLERLQRQAEELASAGDWGPRAEAANKALLRIAPRNLQGINRLARCFAQRGARADALRLWQAVLKIDPSNVVAANRVAEMETQTADETAAASYTDAATARQAGVEARHDGRASRAEALFRRSLELLPTEATRIALAALYRDRGRLDEASTLYEEILASRFNSAAAVGLAAVRRDQKRTGDAIALCEKVLAVGFDAAAATVIAACYMDLGDRPLAEKWAALAVGHTGGDPRAMAVLMANRVKAKGS